MVWKHTEKLLVILKLEFQIYFRHLQKRWNVPLIVEPYLKLINISIF
jgi:hypothetical protein